MAVVDLAKDPLTGKFGNFHYMRPVDRLILLLGQTQKLLNSSLNRH